MESNQKINSSFLNRSFLYFQDNNVVMQFIPIILTLFYGFYNREFTALSRTVLGKLFVVIAILYYSKLNLMYGTFACVLAIFYYQLNDFDSEGFKSRCVDGVLMHKGMPVNPEMASHVYPDIKFANDKPFNPCIFSKMDSEEDLKNPKNSRDFMSIVHDMFISRDDASEFKPFAASIIG